MTSTCPLTNIGDYRGEIAMTSDEKEEFLARRREAGLKIDPATAEVDWEYAQVADPYEMILLDLPEEYQQVGRVYLARSPGSDVWVCFGDLPKATRDALWAAPGFFESGADLWPSGA